MFPSIWANSLGLTRLGGPPQEKTPAVAPEARAGLQVGGEAGGGRGLRYPPRYSPLSQPSVAMYFWNSAGQPVGAGVATCNRRLLLPTPP